MNNQQDEGALERPQDGSYPTEAVPCSDAPVVRRTTLTTPPPADEPRDEKGHRLVIPDEEFAERVKLCTPMIQRQVRKLSSPRCPPEDAKQEALVGVFEAARRDKWVQTIAMENYTRFWVSQRIRKFKNKSHCISFPANDLGFSCPNAECKNSRERLADLVYKTRTAKKRAVDEQGKPMMKDGEPVFVTMRPKFDGQGRPICPICGERLIKNRPPTVVSYDAPLRKEEDEGGEFLPTVRELLPEQKAICNRFVAMVMEAAHTKRERTIAAQMLQGFDPNESAKGLYKNGKTKNDPKELVRNADGTPVFEGMGTTRQRVHQSRSLILNRAVKSAQAEFSEPEMQILSAMVGQEYIDAALKRGERLTMRAKAKARKKKVYDEYGMLVKAGRPK